MSYIGNPKNTPKSYSRKNNVKAKKKKHHTGIACNKRKFATADEAYLALRKCHELEKYMGNREEKRIYWCRFCSAYHLTKQRRWQ